MQWDRRGEFFSTPMGNLDAFFLFVAAMLKIV
jgi:hypothetical protein